MRLNPAAVFLGAIIVIGCGAQLPFPPPSLGAIESDAAAARGLRLLQDMERAITDLAERVTPSVVNLSPSSGPGRLQGRIPNPRGTGSGVVIDATGYIVTNHHVVGDAEEVLVRFSDETKLIGQVVGKDPETDLALVKVSTDRALSTARLGDSDTVRVGHWALAVGNPFGLDRTVTLGVVSGIGRDDIRLSKYENFIQTDSSIFPGNSGGPLFNLRGEVIGINTAVMNSVQGIGFAIPSNMVKQVVDQLKTRGKVIRGWLGVGIQSVTEELGKKFGVAEGEGVLVNEVFQDDPAARGGIQPGDIITKVDGKPVDTPNSLSRRIAGMGPGETTNIEIVRDHKRMELMVALTTRKDQPMVASLPASPVHENLGLNVRDLTVGLAEKFKLAVTRGALIDKVELGSQAETEGLREGDLITEVNREDVETAEQFTKALSQLKRGETLLLRVLREARAFYVVLKHPGKK